MSVRTRLGGLGLGLCAVLAGCTVPATQILAVVDTDFLASDPLRAVHVSVQTPEGQVVTEATFDLRGASPSPGATTYSLPLSFGVIPTNGEPAHRVRVVARGLGDDSRERVRRSALVGFVAQRTLYLPLFLPRACAGIMCPDGTTCIVDSGARCVFDSVNAGDLASVERSATGAELTNTRVTPPYDAGAPPPVDAALDASVDASVPDVPDVPDVADVPDVLDAADAFDAAPDVPASIDVLDVPDVAIDVPRDVLAESAAPDVRVMDVVDVLDVPDVTVDAAVGDGACEGTMCGTECVFLRVNPDHCGACGTRCSTSQRCVAGACAEMTRGTVGTGFAHTCALASDRTVFCWGGTDNGEIGLGMVRDQPTPARVPGLTNVVEIGVGNTYTCARLADRTVWCWGSNRQGECGTGERPGTTNTNYYMPTRTVLPPTVEELIMGSETACVRMTDASTWCWGSSSNGQNGRDPFMSGPYYVPEPSPRLAGLTNITIGAFHGCGLLATGTAKCWGANYAGQRGNGSTASTTSLTDVADLTDIRAISAGTFHTCAALSNGTVWCWGDNRQGQLGDGTMTGEPVTLGSTTYQVRSRPVQVLGISNAVGVSVGAYFSCAPLADGNTACWGEATNGQTGDGMTSPTRTTPFRAMGVSPRELHSGYQHSCGRLADRTLRCWGWNGYRQLAVSGTPPASMPIVTPTPAVP